LENERYLFSWDEIQEKDENQLKEFLNRAFCIPWIKTAKIERIDYGRIIKASSSKNVLSLSLNPAKTNVILKIDDCRYEFIARSENGMLNVYDEKINLISLIQCKQQILRNYLDNPGKKRPWCQKPKWLFKRLLHHSHGTFQEYYLVFRFQNLYIS
jgi:hypothetical protein